MIDHSGHGRVESNRDGGTDLIGIDYHHTTRRNGAWRFGGEFSNSGQKDA